MLELLAAFATKQVLIYTGGSILAVVLTWLLKKIPTAKVKKFIYDLSYGLGKAISGFFTKWKYTKAIWNNTLEPWLIGFLDMIIMSISAGFFDGLRADNVD